MTKEEIRNKVFELQKKISEWDNAYYNLDNPLVEDAVYDIEILKLIKLEQQYASYFTYEELKNSPTQRINASSLTQFEKVRHEIPMLSLNKAYSLSEISKFIDNIKKVANSFSFFVEPKIDGLSISLKYKNGKLIQAATRGDGLVGENVTENVMQIASIPKQISYLKDLEVRGEVYLPISQFLKLNKTLEKGKFNTFANPRNAAAGTLRQLDSAIVYERKLSAFLYYVVSPQEHNISTMEQAFDFLQKHNFPITNVFKVVNSIDEIQKFIDDFATEKLTLDYETDGIVIKLNELEFYNALGQTQKFPHSAIAFKYEPNVAKTIIKDIFITIGRTGLVTYNAKLEPTELSGSLISFATLNNFNYVRDLNLNINDMVYIKKAGEIIPCVIGLANQKNTIDYFKRIENCPYCNSKLIANETFLEEYCENENCPEINRKKLIHFASKECMNFFSVGEKIINKFIELKLLYTPLGFYKLKDKIELLVNLENFGHKSIMKMLTTIEESKNASLDRVIFALSIKHIGTKVANFIASKVLELKNFLSFDFASLINYNEIGEKITSSLIDWVSKDSNKDFVNKLLEIGINAKYVSNVKSKLFENKTFVITGTLSKPRTYFENLILENGGKVVNTVSQKTSYLLVGENPGSKLQKANSLKIEIINEQTFDDILKSDF